MEQQLRANLFWLDDKQWRRIEPHLPTDVRGKERADDRRVISGILHVLRSGCRWKDCPPEYGPYTTIYNRFTRWAQRGVWEHLFRELAARGRSTATRRPHASTRGPWSPDPSARDSGPTRTPPGFRSQAGADDIPPTLFEP